MTAVADHVDAGRDHVPDVGGGPGREQGGQRVGARVVVVTHTATDAAMSETVAALADLDVVQKVASVLRLEGNGE